MTSPEDYREAAVYPAPGSDIPGQPGYGQTRNRG